MPKFGKESFSQLSTCHPELQLLFYEVIKHINCKVLEGYRGQADQEKAFSAGNSKLHYPNGKHNKLPSMAADVAPYPVPPWAKVQDFIYFGGFVMGIAVMLKAQGKMTYSIRYGGDWSRNDRVSDESFQDYVHFEIIL